MTDGTECCRRIQVRACEELEVLSREWRGSHDARCGIPPAKLLGKGDTIKTSTHVVGKNVQRTIVTVCFLFQAVPEIMFRNKVSSTGVQTTGKEATHNKINQWP